MTTLDRAITQMLAAGMPDFPPGHPRTNTRVTRYGPKKKSFYKLYEDRARNGAAFVSGYFGVWGALELTKIEIDWHGVDDDERERLRVARAQEDAREQVKIAERAKFAAARARMQWRAGRSAAPADVATYLARKGVAAEKGLRFEADGTLLVPMIRYDVRESAAKDVSAGADADAVASGPARFAGLQKISADGEKRFNKGMAKVGTACRLGAAPKRGELILVTEGVATALSLRAACAQKHTVFVAFDAGSLSPVVKILRALYPDSPLLICADDDAYLAASMNNWLREQFGVATPLLPPLTGVRVRAAAVTEGEVTVSVDVVVDDHGVAGIVGAVIAGARTMPFSRANTGRVCAQRAAAEAGNATVIFPRFAARDLPAALDEGAAKLTDFNDLHAAEGLAAVTAQLDDEIRRAALSREVAKAVGIEVARAKKSAKAEKKAYTPPPSFDMGGFFKRFTLIYPTDTVYDATLEIIAKLSAVKIAFGERMVKFWLESPDRRTVNADQVVFDPAGACDAATTVNLFRGLPPLAATGAGASCARLLALLQYLCAEDGQEQTPVTEWVLNWLAYPLQHVGAKMATAIVMHGPAEGTGKNLFFNAVRDMYGRYASLITQTQLESPYNGWMSQRLFVIANEVISRQELRHHVGRLKNFITESPLPIEEKFLPIRYEENHMNMVFLTNELQALQISPTDRRYMVIRTPQVHHEAFYAGVLDELANGGVAALHQLLLAREVGDFNEHTKPLMTGAKEDLIEVGLNSPQQFWRELHDGLLYPLEYGPALWGDLYPVYQAWCSRNGVKNPRPSNYFGQEFMSMNGVRRLTMRIADPDKHVEWALPSDKWPQRSVYVMGVQDEGIEHRKWIDKGVKRFRVSGREYVRDVGLRREPRGDDGDRGGN